MMLEIQAHLICVLMYSLLLSSSNGHLNLILKNTSNNTVKCNLFNLKKNIHVSSTL